MGNTLSLISTSTNTISLITGKSPSSAYLSTWSSKTWENYTTIYGHYKWTDDTNIYHSNYSTQHVLNGSTWNTKTWSINFFGDSVWSDGTNIYYSNSTNQYVLNKSTSTWTTKSWSGLTSFSGQYVWTDGSNIYYSTGANQYVLNKSTSTWSTKTWTGLTNFNGTNIWTDGTNIYCSNDRNHYVLNKLTSAWSAKTWTGLTGFYGESVWTDGSNIYYSNNTTQYVLNKSTSTWSAKTWTGLTKFTARDVWSDGTNIYYSNATNQYVLDISIPGVSVAYNNNTIKTQTENGSFTLSCDGKKMVSDVVISATDVQAITATYNGNIIINGSETHTYTLSCNGKKMSSDVVVNVITQPVMPAKGDLINVDMTGTGSPQQYRVIKINNNIAEILLMSNATSIAFDGSSTSTSTYAGKTLDNYLNTTWYNTLSSAAKAAIIDKTFRQDSWYFGTQGNPVYQGIRGGTGYQISLDNASYGNEIVRHCYVLSVQDVLDYLEVTSQMTQEDTTLTDVNVWTMFWNSTITHIGNLWLRSARTTSTNNSAFYVTGNNGNLSFSSTNYTSGVVRPALTIDLSKIDFTIVT